MSSRYAIARSGPTGVRSWVAARRADPIEYYWTRHETNALVIRDLPTARRWLSEATLLSAPSMTVGLVSLPPA